MPNHVTIDELALFAGRVKNFAADLESAIRGAGLFALTPNIGPLMGLYLANDEVSAPTNFDEAKVLNENGLYAVLPRQVGPRCCPRPRCLRDSLRVDVPLAR